MLMMCLSCTSQIEPPNFNFSEPNYPKERITKVYYKSIDGVGYTILKIDSTEYLTTYKGGSIPLQ